MMNHVKKWLSQINDKQNPDEFEAKNLISLYGIKTPSGKRLQPEDKMNSDCIQFPCVLKICDPGVVHKTELNGVILNNTHENVDRNLASLHKRFPGKNILVEPQQIFTGPEFIIGIVTDPALGPAVMIGTGGILTEIYNDTAFRLAPCSHEDAMDMIDELKMAPVFKGFRGLVLDQTGLARAIVNISRLACDLESRLSQLDINPIVYNGNEWVALDIQLIFN